MVLRHTSYVIETVHLYKLNSPYKSIYIYVCSDWNIAYDQWDTFNISSKDKPLHMTSSGPEWASQTFKG